jgi:hypothetical protein
MKLPEQVHETIVNDRISQFLSREFGIDSRAERTTSRKRPDIIITSRGLLIGIESSFFKQDAEKDAKKRVEQRQADMVLALWLKDTYAGLSEKDLDDAIRRARFDIKVFTQTEESLDKYLPQPLKSHLSEEGWYSDIGISEIKEFVDVAPDFLVKEEKVVELSQRIKDETYYFVRSLSSIDKSGKYAKQFYDLFWKLYGLSLGKSPSEISDVIYGQVALSILLSSAFYEHARELEPPNEQKTKKLDSLSARIEKDPIQGLKDALNDLMQIDYKMALRTTVELLEEIPTSMAKGVKQLCNLGILIVEDRALLKRDFAGRIYHQITGDLLY